MNEQAKELVEKDLALVIGRGLGFAIIGEGALARAYSDAATLLTDVLKSTEG